MSRSFEAGGVWMRELVDQVDAEVPPTDEEVKFMNACCISERTTDWRYSRLFTEDSA